MEIKTKKRYDDFYENSPFEDGKVYDVIGVEDGCYYVVGIDGTEEKIHFCNCALVGVKENLDRRICDCEVCAENTMTYREYIQSYRKLLDKHQLFESLVGDANNNASSLFIIETSASN